MRIAHVVLLSVIGAALAFALSGGSPSEARLTIGENELTILIADERTELVKGLGDRDDLPSDHAMLFMFPENGVHGIWMKDMRFPIDIVWFNEGWEVIDIRARVAPETYPEVFYPVSESRYVLEMASGAAEQYGIAVGSVIGL
jgi:uncharacterized membrane protein (UPF0127 family)